MKQHPVPQHIASYQFRLVGQMTLKQFLELAGGIVIGFIIYSLDISPIFKWPLVLFTSLGGIALAFLPFEERSLDQWVINFFKSVYSPTQYIWKKKPSLPAIFRKTSSKKTKKTSKKIEAKDKKRLEKYLETLPSSPSHINKIEEKEFAHLKKISQLLGAPEPKKSSPLSSPPPSSFSLKTKPGDIRVRKLRTKKEVGIPLTKPVQIKKTSQADKPSVSPTTEEKKPVVEAAPPLAPPILVDSSYSHKLKPSVAAQFSTTLPIPQTPNTANIVVGMVLNEFNKIIPNALIEITNQKGETVRALKTNKLGQFFCASPLKEGIYQIKIEHPDYKFDIMELKTKGEIIPPIKIKSKARKE